MTQQPSAVGRLIYNPFPGGPAKRIVTRTGKVAYRPWKPGELHEHNNSKPRKRR